MKEDKDEMIEEAVHPSHYQGKIETIDFIEDKDLGFSLGNAVKYISRAGKKPGNPMIQDLKKAQYYLNREIARLEEEDNGEE